MRRFAMPRRSLPAPLRDALVVATLVAISYLAFFAMRVLQGHTVEPGYAVAQIAFQMAGFGLVVALGSWLVRALNRE